MRFVYLLIPVLVGLLFLPQSVIAVELLSASDANVDTSIRKETNSFTTPDSIIIAPLFAPSRLNVSDEDRYRGIFHYTIDRLGYADIPFHYVVTPDGTILEGLASGDEQRVAISNYDKNPIVIAYLTDQFNNQFDPRALNSVKELSLSAANTNAIPANQIEMYEIVFVRNRDNREVFMETKEVFGAWNTQRTEIAQFVDENYAPESKPYKLEVVSVSTPQEDVEPGEIVDGTITLLNIGQFGLYPFSNSELILTKQDETPSQFFVNNDWESQSQTALFENEDSLPPGEEATFNFKLYAPLFLGERSETFKLTTALGGNVESDPITLSLNMSSSSKQIVEIQDRGFDFYPVYSQPSSSSSEIYRAVPGQRFFFVEDIGNGWYNIDLGNDTTGWIAYWNTTFVN